MTGSLPDQPPHQPGMNPPGKAPAVSDATWEQLRPVLRDYIDCNLKHAGQLAQMPDTADQLAQKAGAACVKEHEQAVEKFASLYKPERAAMFGEEIRSNARDTVIGHIGKVRLNTQAGDRQRSPAENLPPPTVPPKGN